MLKLNHNETLIYPTQYDQTLFTSVEQAFEMGAISVSATIYFGSEHCCRRIQEISAAFRRAHELGMVTVLWAYTRTRNSAFKKEDIDYHVSADLSGQANHLAATLEADIVKQKQAENNGGYKAVGFGHTHEKVYSELTSSHPIDPARYQIAC
jgi:class I fructose-bisphosphate aldolase